MSDIKEKINNSASIFDLVDRWKNGTIGHTTPSNERTGICLIDSANDWEVVAKLFDGSMSMAKYLDQAHKRHPSYGEKTTYDVRDTVDRISSEEIWSLWEIGNDTQGGGIYPTSYIRNKEGQLNERAQFSFVQSELGDIATTTIRQLSVSRHGPETNTRWYKTYYGDRVTSELVDESDNTVVMRQVEQRHWSAAGQHYSGDIYLFENGEVKHSSYDVQLESK